MADKRPERDKATVASHVASKFPKFTRQQGFILALLSVLVGGICFGVYYAGKSQRDVPPANTDGRGQYNTGNDSIQVGNINNASNVTINPKPKTRKREVFQNAPPSTVVLLLKEIDAEPKLYTEYSFETDKHLAWVPVGTEVRTLDEKRKAKDDASMPWLRDYTKVEVLEGTHKGKVGWVTVSKIKSEVVQE